MINSGTPPTRVATGGTPQAMASSAANPNDSISLGISSTCASGIMRSTWFCLPRNETCRPRPARAPGARPDHAPVHRPPSTDAPARCFSTSARIRMQSSTRFTGRKFERWISSFSPSGAYGSSPAFARSGWYKSQFTKFVITRMSFVTPNTSTVSRRRYSLMDGDAVGFLDREFRDREIGAVRAHQRDIRAVQRGDERQPPRGGQHLLGQQRGDGMRDGVMHVQQVEIVVFRHFRHARGQRQAVGRVLKQRIVGDFHFVIVDAREFPGRAGWDWRR